MTMTRNTITQQAGLMERGSEVTGLVGTLEGYRYNFLATIVPWWSAEGQKFSRRRANGAGKLGCEGFLRPGTL
jgi:hypothetical protein